MQRNFGTVFAKLTPLIQIKQRRNLLPAVGLLLWGVLPMGQACAVCFGKTDDPMIQGASFGILTLLGIVAAVLLGVSAFFLVLSRRCRQADRLTELEYSPRQTLEVHHD